MKIDFTNNTIEKSICIIEQNTLALFYSILDQLSNLQSLNDKLLYGKIAEQYLQRQSLNKIVLGKPILIAFNEGANNFVLPIETPIEFPGKCSNNLETATSAMVDFLMRFQKSFQALADTPLAERSKVYFGAGRIYKTVQALSHFRAKYYHQLTTSDYDLSFVMTALNELEKINSLLQNSTCDFSPSIDPMMLLLTEYIPLFVDMNTLVNYFDRDNQVILSDKREITTTLNDFIKYFRDKLIEAAVLCIDMDARANGINIIDNDCSCIKFNINTHIGTGEYIKPDLMQKFQSRPELLASLLAVSKYTSFANIIVKYLALVSAFNSRSKLLRAFATEYPAIHRVRPLAQRFNKGVVFNEGACLGGVAGLLDSDLRSYTNSLPIYNTEKYAELDNLNITQELFRSQWNQFGRNQMDSGKYTHHIIGNPITKDICSSLITEVYAIAKKVLQSTPETDVKLTIILDLKSSAHAVAFYAYGLTNQRSINCLFIDLNVGIFRFILTPKTNQHVIDWIADLFQKLYQPSSVVISKLCNKSTLKQIFVENVGRLNETFTAHRLLKTNLVLADFAARNDDAHRDVMLALLNKVEQGNHSLMILNSIMEKYQLIVHKSLEDRMRAIRVLGDIFNIYLDSKDYDQAMEYVKHVSSVCDSFDITFVKQKASILAKLITALVHEEKLLGSGTMLYKEVLDSLSNDRTGMLAKEKAIITRIANHAGQGPVVCLDGVSELIELYATFMRDSEDNDMQTFLSAVQSYQEHVYHTVVDETHSTASSIATHESNLKPAKMRGDSPITLMFKQSPRTLQDYATATRKVAITQYTSPNAFKARVLNWSERRNSVALIPYTSPEEFKAQVCGRQLLKVLPV